MLHWIKTHKYALVGLYLFVFLAGFGLLELVVKEPKVIIHCPVDDWIPFCEWFVIPYFLWYAWVPVFMIWFMVKSRYDYLKLCFVMLGGATICLVIYAIWPNGLDLRREITTHKFLCGDRAFFTVCGSTLQCVSIHSCFQYCIGAPGSFARAVVFGIIRS